MNRAPVSTLKKTVDPPKPTIVSSTCAILRLLAESSSALGVNAIARKLSMPPSSCFKILKQLQAQDFVDCDEMDKCYSLGTGVIPLGRRALDPVNSFSRLRYLLEDAAHRHSIAIGFWRLLPNRRMVLAGFVEDNRTMRIHMTVGQRLPRLVGGVGRAIAAELNLSKEEMQKEFDLLNWRTPLSFAEYEREVNFARQNGYAVDIGNFAHGVCTVATTISDDEGIVRFGISGIMFNGEYTDDMIARIGNALVELADAAKVHLGWLPGL
ncbi:IclR family transcriptional regulator [Rhizorhapis suberifaciens]|uniref:DNA-binding IclR family transcriptional regulator n=1 Tax=Rhizorhapis suberifaciens TaxID=13656 RepID=A0A840HV80_9SPHN|nr:IclR family transcriptional regulator [Rhizorhapis suberifaciens]MBB4641428.1 DNA-binding IclR family transcriptional regulator [Rhizorhapis suberifaciens]